MKFKRLRHHVQNFGQQFCGWELMFDYKRFADLGSGIIRFDLLKGTGVFNNEVEVAFSSAKGVRQWMLADLTDNGIALEDIKSAVLEVQFETKREFGQTVKSTTWSKPTPYFIKCRIDCSSYLEAGDKKLTSTYTDFHEWPEDYSWLKQPD